MIRKNFLIELTILLALSPLGFFLIGIIGSSLTESESFESLIFFHWLILPGILIGIPLVIIIELISLFLGKKKATQISNEAEGEEKKRKTFWFLLLLLMSPLIFLIFLNVIVELFTRK